MSQIYHILFFYLRYVGWGVCHEPIASEILNLFEVRLGRPGMLSARLRAKLCITSILSMYATSTFPADTILFQPPPFLHPDSTPPKRPWIFIGQTVLAYYALSIWFVQKSAIAKKSAIAGTPGDEAAHIHIDNLGLPSWQVSYLHFSFIGQFPWVIEPLRLHLRDFFSFSECLFRVSRNLRKVTLYTTEHQAQISGVKTWYLRPPPECASSCHPTMQATLYPGWSSDSGLGDGIC